MGLIRIIGVDPEYKRRVVGSRLTEAAAKHMRSRGTFVRMPERRLVLAAARYAKRQQLHTRSRGGRCSSRTLARGQCVLLRGRERESPEPLSTQLI
jgi:GNAT superfamily N-acetyltransferase